MIESLLLKSSTPCEVHVLSLDARALAVSEWVGQAARAVGRHDVIPHRLADLENFWATLRTARGNRAWGHYAWTLGSCWTRDVAKRRVGHPVAYLDADLYFFGDPEACWHEAEIAGASIACVPHRFPPQYEHYVVNGRRNVSWVSFHDTHGRLVLEDWANHCVEKCDASTCGDQRYLDGWDRECRGRVHDFRSKGIGAAPWNVWSYEIAFKDGKVLLDGDELIFYHLHEHRRDPSKPDGFDRTRGYPLREVDVETIYRPYEHAYLDMEKRIVAAGIDLSVGAK